MNNPEPLKPPPLIENAARSTDEGATKYAQNRVLRTVGGTAIAIGAASIAVVLVLRDAPPTAWGTALPFALVGAGLVEPTTVLGWMRKP